MLVLRDRIYVDNKLLPVDLFVDIRLGIGIGNNDGLLKDVAGGISVGCLIGLVLG